jgi:serine/threonine-protein kinase
MIGQTISHYKILEKLGGGGMGVVYKAQDLKLDRFVALKFLPHQLSADEEEKKRFIHEAKAASALDHPNICTIYEINETADGQMFIAMACYEGETLKQKITPLNPPLLRREQKGVPLSRGELQGGVISAIKIDEAIEIAIQIVQGLAKAHEHGIVHRDLKPANVIVTKDGVVKIVDFGLAKLTGATKLTKSNTTMGTAAYMSPEQARGEEVDHRTDIWSVGVILYEMLTGRNPFRGDYDAAITYAILHEEPEPLNSTHPDVPAELQRMVSRAMQKDRNERYQHVHDLLRDLTSFRNQIAKKEQTITANKPRYPLYLGALGMLLVLMVGLYFLIPSKPVNKDRKSIAVLPFKNLSDDKEDEYFSDGVTEDIIAQLSKIGDLKVISRTSAMRYKNTDKSLEDIGRELNVATVLEGSVRRAGNRVRIVSQLIDARDDKHLWAETYDRDMKDIFAIQSEVAVHIAAALQANLFPVEKNRLARKATENLEAYNLYLKGRYILNKGTEDNLKKALQFFEQALEEDPTYAAAYSGLADAYLALDDSDFIPEAEAAPKVKAAGRKALEIDETLAEAHTSLGHLAMHQWDWPTTKSELQRAIELNPGYAPAHHFLSMYLSALGKMDEAIAAAKRAEELDPLSMMVSSTVGVQLYRARRYNEAIAQLRKTLDLDPNYPRTYRALGKVYLERDLQQAVAAFEKYSALTNERSVGLAYLGNAYGRMGKRNEAQRILDELIALSQREYVSAYAIAMVYIGLGDKDQAFEWLNKACEERSDFLVHLKVDPDFDPLRSDSRFAELMKKVGVEK